MSLHRCCSKLWYSALKCVRKMHYASQVGCCLPLGMVLVVFQETN